MCTVVILYLFYTGRLGTFVGLLDLKLNSITFSYLQSDGSTATGADNVAFVEFELELMHAGNVYRQRSRVALRNQP